MVKMEIVKVFADFREKDSNVPSLLSKLNVNVTYKNLTVGDYILPNNLAVERKSVDDFLSSMLSGRLFEQAYRLAEAYPIPIFVIEGGLQNILETFSKPKAVWGALASLSIRYSIHLFFTSNIQQTAELLSVLAHQSLKQKPVEPIIRERRKIRSLGEFQLHVVSSLPGVGLKLADRMLKKFKTVRGIFQASKNELFFVKGLAKSKIDKICELLDTPYKPPETSLTYQKLLEET